MSIIPNSNIEEETVDRSIVIIVKPVPSMMFRDSEFRRRNREKKRVFRAIVRFYQVSRWSHDEGKPIYGPRARLFSVKLYNYFVRAGPNVPRNSFNTGSYRIGKMLIVPNNVMS